MKKSTLAVYRAVAALIAAVILLSVSGFGVVDLLDGPSALTEEGGPTNRSYVGADLTFVMDVVGVEKSASGREVAYYAVSPVGDTFQLFRFPAADLENVRQMEEATDAFLAGESLTMDIYMTMTGALTDMDEAEGTLLLEWFERNVDWMISAGVIAETEDYSSYLNTGVVRVGQVGGQSTAAVVVLSVLAALLVVYAIVEVVLVTVGVYEKKSAPKAKKEKAAPAPARENPVEETPVEETPAEEAPTEEVPAVEEAPVEAVSGEETSPEEEPAIETEAEEENDA